jgi:hypothetical protein
MSVQAARPGSRVRRWSAVGAALSLSLAAAQGAGAGGSFVEPVTVLHTFTAPAPGGLFGWAVSELSDVDGDGVGDVIVGNPFAGPDANGAVFVYSGRSGALLYRFDGKPKEWLGYAVADAGDVNGDGVADIVIGAPHRTRGHVYVRSGADGSLLRVLDGPSLGSRFGFAVAGAGDVNGDGHADLLIGATRAGADRAGRAYVVDGSSGAVLHELAGAGNRDEHFGSAVDWTPDVNGDGVPDEIVGAKDAPPDRRGAATVFSGRTGTPLFTIGAGPKGRDAGWFFVAGVGDLDHDGVPDVYVADFDDRTHGPLTGRAGVYSGVDGRPLHVWVGAGPGEGFGPGREAGDVDGDGVPDIAVGSYRSSDGAPRAGRVQVFSGATGALLRTITSTSAGEELGFDAVGVGDVNGDGIPDLLVSAAAGDTVYLIAGTRP